MKREEGFTLIELLVATMVLGLIVGAITSAIIVGLRSTDAASKTLSESHDAQLVASYFAGDIASADDVALDDTACSGSDPIVRFRWTDDAGVKITSYVLQTVSGEQRITRFACTNGSATSTIPVDHAVMSAAPACTPACPASGFSTPSAVSLCVTESSGYAFLVSGSRRAVPTPSPAASQACAS